MVTIRSESVLKTLRCPLPEWLVLVAVLLLVVELRSFSLRPQFLALVRELELGGASCDPTLHLPGSVWQCSDVQLARLCLVRGGDSVCGTSR